MKIMILSRAPKAYSTRRLKEAAKARGHRVFIRDVTRFAIQVEAAKPGLCYNGKTVGDVDAVIPRIGASVTFYGTAVLRQFEQMGVFTLNTSHAISVSRDKLRSLQVLTRHDVGMPPTAFVRRKEDVLPAIERVGGAPVVIKLLEGTQGIGVVLADTIKMAEAVIEALQSANQNVLIQKFVAESKGRDVRAFVVGGRVVAAMRRTAVGQEFRSNVHRGGRAEAVDLDETYRRTAVHAAQIMGLEVAGVDMLESADGPQIMEINSSPGLEGIEGATGIDVAGAIVQHLEQQVMFPEVDLRQRLTLSKGYGVTEIPVSDRSPLANRPIADSHLREQDIIVLSIHRGGVVIPNPKGAREILPGDVLLCYGKLIALRSLIPPRKPKRSKKSTKQAAATEPSKSPSTG